MKTIAYLIYGNNEDYQLELSLSISSIARFLGEQPSDIQIMLITNHTIHRPDLPVGYIRYTDSEFDEWTGGGAYLHASKVHALIKALKECNGPVALVDTDTYFIQHPDFLFADINNNSSVMHVNEGPIGGLNYWSALVSTTPITIRGYTIDKNSLIYNSGVIGVNPSHIDSLIDASLLIKDLTDLCDIFSIEQFAVTTCLLKRGLLKSSDKLIRHYWSKHERIFVHLRIRDLIKNFGNEYYEMLVKSPLTADLPTISVYDKIVARTFGYLYSWNGNTQFAYLAYRAAASSNNSSIRKGWLQIASLFLQLSPCDDRHLARHFPLLDKSEIS